MIRRALAKPARRLLRGNAQRVAELERRVAELKLEVQRLKAKRLKPPVRPAVEPLVSLDYARAEIMIGVADHKRYRAQSKEPFTVAWIEQTFLDGDILYDIGANIGAYSLIAARVAPGARVVAFEPGCASFAALCRNIAANGLAEQITPLPVTLGATTGLDVLQYESLLPGAGTTLRWQDPSQPAFVQPVLVYRLDDLVRLFELPPPTHVKLDVDGAETAVIEGAGEILRSPRLRTLMVEFADDDNVVRLLEACGFELVDLHRRETSHVRYGRFMRPDARTASAPSEVSAGRQQLPEIRQ